MKLKNKILNKKKLTLDSEKYLLFYDNFDSTIQDIYGISLGFQCNIPVELINLNIKKKKKYGGNTCVFDLMVTNVDGIIKCINENFANFFELNINKDNYIYNNYNFYFNHESNIPDEHSLWEKEKWIEGPNHFVNNNFKNLKKRYQDRIKNFNDYINDKDGIIFMIGLKYGGLPEQIKLDELKDALINTYPNLKFKLYVLLEKSPFK